MNLAGCSSNASIRKSIWQWFFGEHASMSKNAPSQEQFWQLGLCIVKRDYQDEVSVRA